MQLADGTAIDLSRASHFEWSIGARHPLTVGLAIEDTGGRCVLRIDGREVGRFGVSQAFHSDPDARLPARCRGSTRLIESDLLLDLDVGSEDGGASARGRVLLLQRDAEGHATVVAQGTREATRAARPSYAWQGRGSDASVARARRACELASGRNSTVDVWERLAMLGATESERAVCAERLAAALETSIAACTADADVLACRAERAIDARRIAAQLPVDRRLAVEAVVYAELAALVDQARARFAALPELTPTTIRAFRRAAEPLLAHVFDRPLLTALGLDADRARLETSLKPTGSSTASRT